MAGENFARSIVEKELDRATVINDDGSAPSMYDLRIGPPDQPDVAIECFGAVVSQFTETWNVGPAKGPLNLSLRNNWMVEVSPKAHIKTLKKHLEPILQELETRGLYKLLVDYRLKWQDYTLFEKLSSLDITHAVCYEQPGSGKVELGLPGIGGPVDDSGNAIPNWISALLRVPAYQDVLSKLECSCATERHAFVIVGFAGAPWEVESYLTGDMNRIPNQIPDLPFPITAVWIVSQSGRKGIRWDGSAWRIFETP